MKNLERDPKPDRENRLERVFRYHQESKHHFHSYAPGPGYLDWASQPNPFRRYSGSPFQPLEKLPPTDRPLYDEAFIPGSIPPALPGLESISQLFYDSLALSAWKSIGEASWSLRVNPSSGNLHPTEGYLICGPVEGLDGTPGVFHYAPDRHGLELRAELDCEHWGRLSAGHPPGTILVGLTSIHWREAWKYGLRAFRYCQHDVGHAIGAVALAAAGLGWRTRLLDDLGGDELALLVGTLKNAEAEPEQPEVLLACGPGEGESGRMGLSAEEVRAFASLDWRGSPNRLSSAHVNWGMEEMAEAVRKPGGSFGWGKPACVKRELSWEVREASLRRVIRQRRSAVAMDGVTRISSGTFFRMLERTLPARDSVPFSTLPWRPRLHLALFVHRVDELPSGLYFLVRDPDRTGEVRRAMPDSFDWEKPAGCPESLGLFRLQAGDTRQVARRISCFQEIAGDSCFSLGMIAEFEEALAGYGPWFYPRLFWEAGMIGQVLYLEAEAAGVRSTGIGCYFDDGMHEVLGLEGRKYQDLYHFTVGGPVEDPRLTTLSAYPSGQSPIANRQ